MIVLNVDVILIKYIISNVASRPLTLTCYMSHQPTPEIAIANLSPLSHARRMPGESTNILLARHQISLATCPCHQGQTCWGYWEGRRQNQSDDKICSGVSFQQQVSPPPLVKAKNEIMIHYNEWVRVRVKCSVNKLLCNSNKLTYQSEVRWWMYEVHPCKANGKYSTTCCSNFLG